LQTNGNNSNLIKILVIDDEKAIRKSFVFYFEDAGHQVFEAANGRDGLDIFERVKPHIVFTDLRMPVMDGYEFLRQAYVMRPETPIIVVSGIGVVADAIKAVKLGAWDFITKPLHAMGELDVVVKRAIEAIELRREVSALREQLLEVELGNEPAFRAIVTSDEKMVRIFHYLEAVAPTAQPLLITGETGTGKELVARAAHDVSRRKGAFIAVNVSGVDDNVFSDTLFGHVRGAFTGADRHREGMIAQAEAGTLFLDEIGDLGNASQVKLLRLIQEKEYMPLGADKSQATTCRIIAATNRDLRKMVDSGDFRQDLYYRLNGHHVHIPPLRERKGDLGLLLEHFVEEAAQSMEKKTPPIPPELGRYLESYDFPGNVRELKSMVYDAVALNSRGALCKDAFVSKMGKGGTCEQHEHEYTYPVVSSDGNDERLPTLKEAEDELIRRAMQRAGGNQGVAARYLGITRQGLNKILNRDKTLLTGK